MHEFEFNNESTIRIKFTDMEDNVLYFNSDAYIVFDFIEGTHNARA